VKRYNPMITLRIADVGIVTGPAFSAKQLGTTQVSVCFFGEGGLGQGILYEVMNLAQLWNLPVIYVCENHLYKRVHTLF
jgi:TPP-dependent pyruvate/acetoin dehydrogenase alpha subunit